MKKLIFTLLLVAGFMVTDAQALNLRWLNYSPVRYYNDEDWSIYSSAVQDALNNQPDGTTLEWENPKTGAAGKVTPIKTYKTSKRTCRKVKIFNSIKGLTGQSVHFFCRPQEGGEWMLTEPNTNKQKSP